MLWRRAAAHGHGDATHTGVMFRPVPVASSLSPVPPASFAVRGQVRMNGGSSGVMHTAFIKSVGLGLTHSRTENIEQKGRRQGRSHRGGR